MLVGSDLAVKSRGRGQAATRWRPIVPPQGRDDEKFS